MQCQSATLISVTVWQRRVALTGIVLLAAVVRVWDLQEYPPGLFPDQAANGEDALDILQGRLQFFSQRNNGRESLFFYVQAATISLFGIGVWQMFLASALVGVATVLATYAAGAALLGPSVGLLAAFFLSTNTWHVTLSRSGFRAVMVPLFIALSLFFIARILTRLRQWSPKADPVFPNRHATPTEAESCFTLQAMRDDLRPSRSDGGHRAGGEGGPRRRDALLAGFMVGLGLYTYGAYRAFGLFLMCAGVVGMVRLAVEPRFRARARAAIVPSAMAGVVALATAAPLLAFFARHLEFVNYQNRLGYLLVWNPDLSHGHPFRALLRTTTRTLRGFVVNGDGNPRHNVSFHPHNTPPSPGCVGLCGGGAPFLSLVPAVLGMVGLFVAAKRATWLVGLFAIMLLPAVVTVESIPHGLRTAGVIPAHVWLAGLGGVWLLTLVHRYRTWGNRRLWAVIATLALLGTVGLDLWIYFGLARHSPFAYDQYRGDLAVVSRYLNERARTTDGVSPYLVLDDFSVQTVHFLTTPTGYPYRLLRPENSHFQDLQPGEEVVFTRSTLSDAERYRLIHPSVRAVFETKDQFGRTAMVVLAK